MIQYTLYSMAQFYNFSTLQHYIQMHITSNTFQPPPHPALHYLLKIITLLCYYTYIVQTQQTSLSLTLSSATINTDSIYNFEIIDINLSTRDGTITLVFDSTLFSIGTVSVYNTVNQAQIYGHTVINLFTISVTYLRPTQISPVVRLSISTIRNPGSRVSPSFNYKFTSSGTQYTNYSRTLSPFVAASLQSCSITFNPSTTNTQSVVTVTLTPRNTVSIGGKVSVTYPSLWQNSYNDLIYTPIMYSFTTCAKVSGSYFTNSPVCSITGRQVYVDAPAFTTAVVAGQAMTFTMTGIRSSATTTPNNFVTISTQTPAGFQVDQSQCTVNVVSPQLLSISSTSTFVVGRNSEILTMSWITNSPIRVGDSITLTLPANYMQYGSGSLFISYDSGKSISYTTQIISSQIKKYTISAIDSSLLISPSQTIQIGFIYVRTLIDTSPRNVLVSVTRNNYIIAEGTLSITPSSNTLTSVALSSTIATVSTATALTFVFTTTNAIPTTAGQIRIQIPSSMQVVGSTPNCVVTSLTSSSVLSGSSTCTFASSIITISSFLTNSLPVSSQLSITVSNLLVNPVSVQPTTTFVISTFSAAGFAIDQHSSLTYTASSAAISQFNVVPSSFIVAQNTPYTLTYTIARRIPSGSSIIVTLPASITFPTSLPVYTYKVNTGSETNVVPVVTTSNSRIVLSFRNIVTTTLVTSDIVQFKITSLHNPQSVEPTQSFLVQTRSPTDFMIQSLSTGKQLTMLTLIPFTQFTPLLSTNLRINGATADYTFYFKTSINLRANYKLILQIFNSPINNQLQFSSAVTICSIGSLTNTCLLSNNQLTITLSGDVAASSTVQYRLLVSSLKLARTMSPTSQFKLKAVNSNDFGISQSIANGIVNTQPNKIQQLSLSISTNPSQLNQIQSFSISVTLFNAIYFANSQYLLLQLPTNYHYLGLGTCSTNICSSNTNNLVCTIPDVNNPNAIKIISTSTATTATTTLTIPILIGCYVSPQDFGYQNYYYYLTSYEATNTRIDNTDTANTNTAVTFYTTCNNHCKTCSSSSLSSCLTCYATDIGQITPASYSSYIYMTSDNRCVTQCGNGYYNQSGICTRCTSPCATCLLSATNCLSCVNTYYYSIASLGCVAQCPARTYATTVTNTCQQCSPTCLNCTTNSITCTSCDFGNSKYLLNSACVGECGLGFYQNTVTGVCTVCNAGCDGCNINATDCVACKSGYFLESVSTTNCVNSCPAGKVSNVNTGLCQCGASCFTCSGTLTTCLSCAPGVILYSNNCITQCPGTTYQSGLSCLQCQDTNCIDCTASSCSQCSSGYLLYNGLCYTACPDSTYKTANAYTCSLCQLGCKSCLDASTCVTCYSGYLIKGLSCVTTCGVDYINFNATICVTQCPAGYINSTNRCTLQPTTNTNTTTDNTTNNTTTIITPNITQQIPTFVPFPYTIAYVLTTATAIGMKCMYPATLLPVAMMTFGAVLESAAVITIVGIGVTDAVTVNTTRRMLMQHQYHQQEQQQIKQYGKQLRQQQEQQQQQQQQSSSISQQQQQSYSTVTSAARLLQTTDTSSSVSLSTPLIILIVALAILLVLNISNLFLLVKYLHVDPKFQSHYNKSKCSHILLRVLATITHYKLYQLVFSNVLGIRVFKAKLQFVNRLMVQNIMLIISIFWAILAIVGAGLLSYNIQDLRLSSQTFIQSIDTIVILAINIVVTILVLRRHDQEYQVQVEDDHKAKRYQTNQQLNFNEGDNDGIGGDGGIDQAFHLDEDSGVANANQSRLMQSRKGYFYKTSEGIYEDSSVSKKKGEIDKQEVPLSKRNQSRVTPINGNGGNKNADGDNQQGDSSVALFGTSNKKQTSKLSKLAQLDQNQQIQEIMLEQPPLRENLINDSPNKNTKAHNKLSYANSENYMKDYQGYDLDPKLLLLAQNSSEFKKLPAQTKKKIRLAKANMQIHKNSQQINKSQTINHDMEQILLSPKKKKNLDENGEEIDVTSQNQNELAVIGGGSHSNRKSKSKPKSKSKSKSKQKQKQGQKSMEKTKKNKSKAPNQLVLLPGQTDMQGSTLKRNQSQQMKKKQLQQAKNMINPTSTKSQNLKKKKKLHQKNSDIKIRINGKNGNNKHGHDTDDLDDGQKYDQQPSLPIFKHNSTTGNKGAAIIANDGLDILQPDNNNSNGGNQNNNKHHGTHSSRQRQAQNNNQQSPKNTRNRANSIGNLHHNNNKNMKNAISNSPKHGQQQHQHQQQQHNVLPKMHSSQQINNLILNNTDAQHQHVGNNKELVFSNDDQSIYHKIYNDDTETLKSIQNDMPANYFNQQISPSQFNMQNQRFDQTDISQGQQLPTKPIIYLQQQDEYQYDDGLQLGNPRNNKKNTRKNRRYADDQPEQPHMINRYASQTSIVEYDSVISRRANNQKIKQLEKIYLPRLETRYPSKKK